jgi:glycosyltransferase involved in cell wall biosynthesis
VIRRSATSVSFYTAYDGIQWGDMTAGIYDASFGAKKLIHRHVWQRLPYYARRRVLFAATSALAPRPTPRARPNTPFIVVGPLRTASGLGQSARLCYEALRMAGFEVRGIDLTSTLMQPVDFPSFEWIDGWSCIGPGTLIIHVNAPFLALAMAQLGTRVRDKFVVGYWAWELPCVPDEWSQGIPFAHEIWVPSRFVADAVQPIASGRVVRILPHPVALRPMKASKKRPPGDGVFRVLSVFNAASSFARKNPLATVSAFRAAFGNDQNTHLTIKVSNLSTFKDGARVLAAAVDGCSNISVLTEVMDPLQLETLYAEADVLLSLHRAEGFGLTMAEAMLRAMPVIATNWSGNVDFLNEVTGVPITYNLVPAIDPQGTYHHPSMMWAEPDFIAAAMALRRLRADPAVRARLGAKAAKYARQTWTAGVYGSAIRAFLGNVGRAGAMSSELRHAAL